MVTSQSHQTRLARRDKEENCGSISPSWDIVSTSPSCGSRCDQRTLKSTAAFLRTCQQACDEGTDVLYGDSIFWFDDSSHFCDWHRTAWASGEGHGVQCCSESLPECDYLTMADWFDLIGEYNRLKVRHLRLAFTDSLFRICHADKDNEGWPVSRGGGDELVRAFRQLAQGHNLKAITMSFEDAAMQQGCLVLPEWTGNSVLLKALRCIKGIKELRMLNEMADASVDWIDSDYPHPSDWPELTSQILNLLKTDVEAGYETREKVQCVKAFSKTSLNQAVEGDQVSLMDIADVSVLRIAAEGQESS